MGAAAGGPRNPAYQDGGDDQRGVEKTVGDVGGVEAAVHAEALCHVPLADLRRPRGEDGKTWGRDSLGCRLLDLRMAENSALLWVNTRREGWGYAGATG